jgi:hypothetical protein
MVSTRPGADYVAPGKNIPISGIGLEELLRSVERRVYILPFLKQLSKTCSAKKSIMLPAIIPIVSFIPGNYITLRTSGDQPPKRDHSGVYGLKTALFIP